MSMIVTMDGVHEYVEEMPVELHLRKDNGRLVVRALNEAGYSSAEVDLVELLAWLKCNRPNLIELA